MKSNPINCENTLLAAMAFRDGENLVLSPEQAEAHLTSCEKCRREIGQLENVINLLENQKRAAQPADLWAEIENRLEAQTSSAPRRKWQAFPIFGALLVAYKLLEMLPERDFGWTFKLVPLIFVVALFLFLRENPFKINSELKLEN